jgi:putative membrane protein
MRPQELLGDDAFSRVEGAIRAAEAHTSGEIVVRVVERSDSYLGPRSLLGAALAFTAGAVYLATPLPTLWLPAAQAAVFALACAASGRSPLLRAIVPRAWRREQVERAAGVAFLEHGLSHTRERTGILIYLSLAEHEVEVLGDQGIASRVDASTWSDVVALILDGIRAGQAERGLSQAVQRCGEILAAHFPARADNPNELPDSVHRS